MQRTEDIVNKVIEALEDNKAQEIVKIDLRGIENCFCRFFVVCHGVFLWCATGLQARILQG